MDPFPEQKSGASIQGKLRKEYLLPLKSRGEGGWKRERTGWGRVGGGGHRPRSL